jgi:hypothetical protein
LFAFSGGLESLELKTFEKEAGDISCGDYILYMFVSALLVMDNYEDGVLKIHGAADQLMNMA